MTKEQDKLVTANMGYVVTLARQYKSEILSTDDLVSEGAIGLMNAAEKYDASNPSSPLQHPTSVVPSRKPSAACRQTSTHALRTSRCP